MTTCINTASACRLSICEYCNPSKESVADLEAGIAEMQAHLQTAKAKNLHELVDALNHDIRKYRRAIKKLKAGE